MSLTFAPGVSLRIQALLLRHIAASLACAQENRWQWRAYPTAPAAFEDIIGQVCQRYDVDPTLVKGLIKAESGFNPQAVSSAGAKGLMQLMDATAASLGVSDPFDPLQNVDAGVRHLRQLLDRYRDEALALAAYNAGAGAVDRYGGIPPLAETRVFVPRVLSYREAYADSQHWEA